MNFCQPCVVFALPLLSAILIGCSSSDSSTKSKPDPQPESESQTFNLQFAAQANGMEYLCGDTYNSLGPNGDYSVGIGDLRFYVSNLTFYSASGEELEVTLDDGDFQLNHEAGSVALIDLSDKSSGYCADAAEGTTRTNTVITGTTADDSIAAVSFDVGVPQAVMKAVIAATDNVADTPSPLNEMYWSWASGYRHFVMNFSVMDAVHTDMVENSGFHIGSRDCGGAGKALSDRDSCGLVNTPQVHLENFDPSTQTIIVDINALLADATAENFAPNGTPGLQCHSAQMQAACQALFPNFGLDISDGSADAASNTVFIAL